MGVEEIEDKRKDLKKAYKPTGTAENWQQNYAFLNTATGVFLHTGQMRGGVIVLLQGLRLLTRLARDPQKSLQ